MKRKIIKIDEQKCNGCELCVTACHEGAIGMLDGKAHLLKENYCDGLGDCLPVCPTGAITFEEREAPAYDEAAVLANKKAADHANLQAKQSAESTEPLPCGCPGSNAKAIFRAKPILQPQAAPVVSAPVSQLNQWPVQIKLVPVNAPYFDNANLLVAADCTAFAYGDFHNKFIKNKVTIIGCPKLDMIDYSTKLTAILESNNIKSITVVRMQVPCCGGIVQAVTNAIKASGKMIPWQVVVISTDGEILE